MKALADTIILVLLIIVLGIATAALTTLCSVLFPTIVNQSRRHLVQAPIRMFVIGLINFTFFGFIAGAVASLGQLGGLIGLIITTILFSYVAVGLTGVAKLIGERLRLDDGQPLRQLVAGTVVLELAALMPVVGWFAVLPVAAFGGYGAVVATLVERWRASRRPLAQAQPTMTNRAVDE